MSELPSGYLLPEGKTMEDVRALDAKLFASEDRSHLKELLSAIKQHRNATESRLRLINGREASDTMLKPDANLYQEAERIEAEAGL